MIVSFSPLHLKSYFLFFFVLSSTSLMGQSDTSTKHQDPLAAVVEKTASFRGGEIGLTNFIKNNLQYPIKAKTNKVEGTCYLTFVVEKDGNVGDIKILKGIPNGEDLDSVAVWIVKTMPKWTPA